MKYWASASLIRMSVNEQRDTSPPPPPGATCHASLHLSASRDTAPGVLRLTSGVSREGVTLLSGRTLGGEGRPGAQMAARRAISCELSLKSKMSRSSCSG